MMTNSFDHRLLIKNTDRKYYDQAFQEFSNLLESEIGTNLYSLILYGSLAKNSVIPGWSDLDVLIVLSCKDMRQFTTFSNTIHSITQSIYKKYHIYISLDIIKKEELPDHGTKIPKLLGNPLIKTYEIKKYGKCIRGENFLNQLEIEENNKLLIFEEYLNILLFIHGFRKFCCQAISENENQDYLIAKIILGLKTVLKILKSYYNILGGRETSIEKRNNELFSKIDPNIPNSQDLIQIINLRSETKNLKLWDEIELEKKSNEIITLSNILADYVINKVNPLIEV